MYCVKPDIGYVGQRQLKTKNYLTTLQQQAARPVVVEFREKR